MDKLTKAIISSAMTGILFFCTSLIAVFPPPPSLIYATFFGSIIIFISHCRPSFQGDDPPTAPAPAPGQIPPDPSPPNDCRAKAEGDAKDDAPKFPILGVLI